MHRQQSPFTVRNRRYLRQPLERLSGQDRGKDSFVLRSQGQPLVKSVSMADTGFSEPHESDIDMSYSSDSDDGSDFDSPIGTLAPYIKDCALNSLAQYSRQETEGQKRSTSHTATLGCPFFLTNPRDHRDCLRFGLQDIHAVKKHVIVHHQRPPYCFICGRIFITYAVLDEHMKERSCPLTEHPPVAEGVDQAQIERLSRRSDRSIPRKEQHLAVWNLIFPGMEVPRTGLWLDPQDKDVQATRDLREFWARNGTKLVGRFLDSKIPRIQWKDSGLKAFQREVLCHMLQLVLSSDGADGVIREKDGN